MMRAPALLRTLTRAPDPQQRHYYSRARGHIIASGGSGMIGEATLVGCVRLTQELFDNNRHRHKTDVSWASVAAQYKNPHAWVFASPTRYAQPVYPPRKPGQVIWALL